MVLENEEVTSAKDAKERVRSLCSAVRRMDFTGEWQKLSQLVSADMREDRNSFMSFISKARGLAMVDEVYAPHPLKALLRLSWRLLTS